MVDKIVRFFWWLSIFTLPLLMLRYYRFGDIPLTNLFLILAAVFHLPTILKDKIGSIEKSFYLLFSAFILISFLDLTRQHGSQLDYFFPVKLVILLFTIKLYSFFIYKYGLELFLKYLTLGSAVALVFLLLRSLLIYN